MPDRTSVLDNIPIKTTHSFDHLMKSLKDQNVEILEESPEQAGKTYTALGSCPKCGAPVYGPLSIEKNETPKAIYSCKCGVDWADVVKTK